MTTQLPKVSDASMWMTCNGSFRAQQAYPPLNVEPSQSRLEGRAAHEVAQKLFKNEPFSGLVGSLSKDGIIITDELFDAAREYFNEVWGYCNTHGRVHDLHVEEVCPVPGYGDWYCIPDAWVYVPEVKVLRVWDAKFGHRIVDPFENWQLLIEAFSICEQFQSPPGIIELVIVQPRGFSSEGTVRKWVLTYDELCAYRQQVNETMPRVLDATPMCTSGPHCLDCSARAHCDTLKQQSYAGVDYVQSLQTHNLSGHALGVELRLLQRAQEMIKMRLSGLEEQALHEIKQGQHVTFYTAKTTYGRKRWKKDVPVDQVIMMGDLLGQNLRKPQELDTPAQCIKKGIDPSVIEQYAETPVTGVKLEQVDERVIKNVFSRK
ncbi:DUF2800 domain-containing protein [Klebsiella pneumoniae]|uniref:DUF2800 domain-containing protein n=1 Tax=Klebsiella phage vB_KpnM_KpV52 TaxID=1912321 RepID=A0A1I9SEX4_9CAUD|nr:DUF2800 domain-containing protein [Klebsiella pneumoniae]YP_009597585.1 exonuclease [Klebsiella phage vB_KpnM_KpV52]AOZ65401.1 hypothetical protein kpv52_57 [Klebsiella phage vB_KpnM_KpV52]MBE9269748.1 DUF2800 domain-containing protein [Klebsiella pneumoniae]